MEELDVEEGDEEEANLELMEENAYEDGDVNIEQVNILPLPAFPVAELDFVQHPVEELDFEVEEMEPFPVQEFQLGIAVGNPPLFQYLGENNNGIRRDIESDSSDDGMDMDDMDLFEDYLRHI